MNNRYDEYDQVVLDAQVGEDATLGHRQVQVDHGQHVVNCNRVTPMGFAHRLLRLLGAV